MEQRVSNDAYHRGYVDVPSERVWDLPHIKRAIAWASFERECDEKRPDGSVHLHGRYRVPQAGREVGRDDLGHRASSAGRPGGSTEQT